MWKATQPQEFFTDDWHDPQAMYDKAEREVSNQEFKESYIIGSDPEQHVERIREVEQLGATTVCLQNASGADPRGALRVYGERVLPALKGRASSRRGASCFAACVNARLGATRKGDNPV